MTPELVKRAADRAALRSEGKDPHEGATDTVRGSYPVRRSTLKPHRPSSVAGWPISLSFLGLAGVFLGMAAAMTAFPAYARWCVFPLVLAGWLISLCLHEFGHAVVAYYSGDHSVRAKGYLRLDLLRYTHTQYSIVLPLAFLALGGIGLPGGAVYINKRALRSRLHRMLVSAGGPVATLFVLVSLISATAAMVVWAPPGESDLYAASPADTLYCALAFLALLQLTALIFNLLPIPGLDGWGILEAWLSRDLRELGRRFGRVAPILLLLGLAIPPVNRAFWGAVYRVSHAIGLDVEAGMVGLLLFAFWR